MALLPAPPVGVAEAEIEAIEEGVEVIPTVLVAILVDERVVFWKGTVVLETAVVDVAEVVVIALDDEREVEVDDVISVERWETWMVLVVVLARMLKGFEYWKTAGSESSWILMP
jgi:hypothetical protein